VKVESVRLARLWGWAFTICANITRLGWLKYVVDRFSMISWCIVEIFLWWQIVYHSENAFAQMWVLNVFYLLNLVCEIRRHLFLYFCVLFTEISR
jgi:hypothetical protein